MIKPYLKYILPVVILAVILSIMLSGRSPFGRKNSSFAIKPGSEITKIEISEGDRRMTLEKKESEWLVNGEEESRKNRMLFILEVLRNIRIKSPVSQDLFENEITQKGIKPVKVRVFQGRRIIKSFLVYRTSSNPYGNIMKIRERSKPFIVNLPGAAPEIGSLFTANELVWKPFYLFSLPMPEIQSVTFENMRDSASSFMIRKDNNHLFLSDATGELTGWDSLRVSRYLSYFFSIPFEDWASELTKAEMDSICSEPPLYIIKVLSAGGKNKEVTLWERYKTENGVRKPDSDRLWAKSNESEELMILKYFDVDPLLKKKSYFFPG